jgi:hypothetical protein
MLSGVGLTPPTLAHPIAVSGSAAITGTTATVSALGSDAAGASKLVYDWSILSAPAGGGATFSANGTNAAQNTALTFTKSGVYNVSVKIVDPSGLSVTNTLPLSVSATFSSVKLTTPAGAIVSPSASLQVAGVSQSLVAQGLDQFGNALATQPVFTWSTSSVPSGATTPGLSGSGASATFTFGKIGSFGESVLGTAGAIKITDKASLLVVATPSYITVTQVGGSTQITSATAQFSASQLLDQFHAPMSVATQVAWKATALPSGATTPTFTSGATTTATFKAAGQYTLMATESDAAGHSISQTITATVVAQATGASKQSVTSVSVTGTSQKLTAPTIVDQFGNALAVQPSLTWSASALPTGASAPSFATVAGSTTVTFAMAGTYSLTAKVAGAASISFVMTATVTPTLTSIVVTPNATTVAAGGTQQYAASALDQFNKALASQPVFTWSASGGTITTGGLFTAPGTAAGYTISAKNGSVTGTTTVTVQASSGNLQNAFLNQLIQSLDADGSISRNDMLQILDAVAAKGAVTASELADLKKIVSEATALSMPGYVQVLAGDVVNGNTANASYLGQTLGNLAAGSSSVQLNDLIGKWFLGTDEPALTDPSLVYKTASGSLFPTTPSHLNEFQGQLGDCYFISSLGTIADRNPSAVQNMFINNGDGTYTVRFYTGNYGSSYNPADGSYSDGFTSGVGTADYVTVNMSLATTTSGMLVYADYGANYANASNSLWIPLAEKAYAQWNQTGKEGRNGQNSFSAIEGGWMATVDAQVLGHNATDYTMSTSHEQQLISALASGQSVTIGTTQSIYGLYGSHAYAVTAYNASTDKFTLYNPWGFDQPGQLTWSQLQTACSAFTATNSSGSTPIGSGVLKSAVVGALASEALSPAPSAAASGQTSASASDHWFAGGGSAFAAGSGTGAQVPMSAASNPAASAIVTPTTTDVVFGDASLLDADAHSLADPSSAQADLFYAALGVA